MTYITLFLAVLLGVLAVLIIKPHSKTIQLLLSFSGAYLLSMTVLHLIPEVYSEHTHNIGLFILIGILIQTILEYFSKGAEHGHVHVHGEVNTVPWMLVLSLGIHAFIEGIPLHEPVSNELLWGIVVHKIPVTLVLAAFLLRTQLSKIKIFLVLLLFAIMSPLGAIAPEYILFFSSYRIEIMAVIIGVLLHIATAILFESSQNHQFNIKKFVVVLVGFSVAYLSTLIGH